MTSRTPCIRILREGCVDVQPCSVSPPPHVRMPSPRRAAGPTCAFSFEVLLQHRHHLLHQRTGHALPIERVVSMHKSAVPLCASREDHSLVAHLP